MADRVVLVTGASGGIGQAIARVFADAGDRVALHYSANPDRAEETLADLPGSGHLTTGADLRDPAAVRSMVEKVAGALDGIDVLVNNAGVFLEHDITGTSYDDWQRTWRDTLDANLVGPANVTWCAVPHLIAAGGGRIVNVSSRGAFRGEPHHVAYGASKAGLNSFGQSLARALAPYGIAVTTVAPGFVDTRMAQERLDGPDGARLRAQSPFDRVATPEDVACAVRYLASPEAEYASGTILDVNGASYLRS